MPSSPIIDDTVIGFVTTILGCHRIDENRCTFLDQPKEEGRVAWGIVGDVIEATPFLPITINVPDMIYGMYEMFNRVVDYFMGSDNPSTPRIWDLLREVEDSLPDI